MSEEPFDFGKVSSSCMIVGTALGLAVSLLIALVITLAEGLGFALFFWITVLLTLMLSVILMTSCARSRSGDLFGVGRSLGLQKAEREGRLSVSFVAEQARAKAAQLAHSGGGEGGSGSVSAKASEVAEKVKQAAGSAVGQAKKAVDETVEKARQAVASEDASPPAEQPETTPQPAAPAPAPPPAAPTAAATPGAPLEGEDDLTRIKGIGPQAAATLKELGVTRFEQIAAWTDEDIDRMDERLGGVRGRIRRDDWIGQAKTLAAGQAGS